MCGILNVLNLRTAWKLQDGGGELSERPVEGGRERGCSGTEVGV